MCVYCLNDWRWRCFCHYKQARFPFLTNITADVKTLSLIFFLTSSYSFFIIFFSSPFFPFHFGFGFNHPNTTCVMQLRPACFLTLKKKNCIFRHFVSSCHNRVKCVRLEFEMQWNERNCNAGVPFTREAREKILYDKIEKPSHDNIIGIVTVKLRSTSARGSWLVAVNFRLFVD